MTPGATEIPLAFYLALAVPVAATSAFFMLRFLQPREYPVHPGEPDDGADDDQSPSSSDSTSPSGTVGSVAGAETTGESEASSG
jgi:hypothetical protein